MGACFFKAEDGIRDVAVTGVQTCALPICDGDAAQDDEDLDGPGGEEDDPEGEEHEGRPRHREGRRRPREPDEVRDGGEEEQDRDDGRVEPDREDVHRVDGGHEDPEGLEAEEDRDEEGEARIEDPPRARGGRGRHRGRTVVHGYKGSDGGARLGVWDTASSWDVGAALNSVAPIDVASRAPGRSHTWSSPPATPAARSPAG